MHLYFLRHGEAEDYQPDDHARALTAKGKARIETVAHILKKLDIPLGKIYTSPRIRALQTAQIVGAQYNLEPHITEDLNYGFQQEALANIIAPHADDEHIMLVGHEPTFSQTLGYITGARLHIHRGGLARVDVTKNDLKSGVLVWLIAPKVFDNLDY